MNFSDKYGSPLILGHLVAFKGKHGNSVHIGRIMAFTPKKVKIKYHPYPGGKSGYVTVDEILRDPYDVINIEQSPKILEIRNLDIK